jgi:hypothetical protein
MRAKCKRPGWCGIHRAFGDGPLCFCTRKCRSIYERKNKAKRRSVMKSFERVYGPLGDSEGTN